MDESKRRTKFTSERNFEEGQSSQLNESEIESDNENSTDNGNDLSGIEVFDGEEGQNSNQNARSINSPIEEGEASSSSDSDADLRKVIQAKQGNKRIARKLIQEKERAYAPLESEHSTSGHGQSVERARADNANFENFMIWMDKYKQFQEWESRQPQPTGPMKPGETNRSVDKAIQSPSETTVYTRMCKSVESRVNSSQQLGEEDTSGIIENGRLIIDQVDCSSTASTLDDYAHMDDNQIDSLILDARKAAERAQGKRRISTHGDALQPESKRRREEHQALDDDDAIPVNEGDLRAERESKERRDKILLDAELHRAQLLKPGMSSNLNHLFLDAQHRSLGSHVDRATEMKIMWGEYIELHELLPKKRVGRSRSTKPTMRLINVNGQQRWVEDPEDQIINSYRKWEEAFEIFASIYVRGNPGRANQLYEYKYDIRDAANSFIWENVFDYDIEFRLHMAKHKDRDWSARLTDKYTKFMKNHIRFDRSENTEVRSSYVPATASSSQSVGKLVKNKENCRRYNKGRCTWGKNCRYVHRCDICGKRGHGAVICRNNDKIRKNASNESIRSEARSNAN